MSPKAIWIVCYEIAWTYVSTVKIEIINYWTESSKPISMDRIFFLVNTWLWIFFHKHARLFATTRALIFPDICLTSQGSTFLLMLYLAPHHVLFSNTLMWERPIYNVTMLKVCHMGPLSSIYARCKVMFWCNMYIHWYRLHMIFT